MPLSLDPPILKALASCCPHLETLNISCSLETVQGFTELLSLKELAVLELYYNEEEQEGEGTEKLYSFIENVPFPLRKKITFLETNLAMDDELFLQIARHITGKLPALQSLVMGGYELIEQ